MGETFDVANAEVYGSTSQDCLQAHNLYCPVFSKVASNSLSGRTPSRRPKGLQQIGSRLRGDEVGIILDNFSYLRVPRLM